MPVAHAVSNSHTNHTPIGACIEEIVARRDTHYCGAAVRLFKSAAIVSGETASE
jgi:hypothetical protein